MKKENNYFIFLLFALVAFGAVVLGVTHFGKVSASIGSAYFDMGGKRLYNVGLPQGSTEAATQGYVLGAAGTKYAYGENGGGCIFGVPPPPIWPATGCTGVKDSGTSEGIITACAAGFTRALATVVYITNTDTFQDQWRCICTTSGGCPSA